MTITIEFAGPLRSLVGKAAQALELAEGADVATAIQHLGATVSDSARSQLLTASGDVQPSLIVAVNGTACSGLQAHQRLLQPGDVVALLSPIAGG